jgi:Rrf2 family protein
MSARAGVALAPVGSDAAGGSALEADSGVSESRRSRRDSVGSVRISERVDNAVRAMAELAAADGSNAKAESIATSQGISLKFLLDIFRDLKRGELVRSKRGPDGGFTLSRPPEEISLADIFRAVDGPLADVHDESLRDLHYDGPAEVLPEVWMAIRGSLRRVLETVTLADLASGDLPAEVVDLAAEYRRTTAERHGTRSGPARP